MSTIISHLRFASGTQPESLYEPYLATRQRSPRQPLIYLPHTLSERTGPVYGHNAVAAGENDLTAQHAGEPVGPRIVVTGKVMDEGGRPLRNTLIEIWQANAGGRYFHHRDNHPAPLDPNFHRRRPHDHRQRREIIASSPSSRAPTRGTIIRMLGVLRTFIFRWSAHRSLARLVTQMYFPDDPLFPFDPIFQSVRDEKARNRLISTFDLQTTVPGWALGFQFNVVLRGPDATPFED